MGRKAETKKSNEKLMIEKAERQRKLLEKLEFVQLVFNFYTATVM